MKGQIAILRRCARCKRWESIDNYDDNAKVCHPCMPAMNARPAGIQRSRGIVITESGRELLEQWRREEVGAA